jgi:hypothetical protein
MSAGKTVLLLIIFVVLAIGISAPFQNVADPIYLGFLPAPVFYLLIFHFLFVCFIGYLAFGTKLHGRVEDEQAFLAEVRGKKGVGK